MKAAESGREFPANQQSPIPSLMCRVGARLKIRANAVESGNVEVITPFALCWNVAGLRAGLSKRKSVSSAQEQIRSAFGSKS